MTKPKLTTVGILGTVATALCCVTPIPVILLSAIGLSVWVGWLDYIVMPALVFFVLLTIYAYRQRNKTGNRNKPGNQ